MKRFSIYSIFFAIFIFIETSLAAGAELYIPELKDAEASRLDIPLKLDQAQNLAGVKLVLAYDKNILEFKKAFKTKDSSSLMHIVNSKKPGRLIIVMAGAMGISGHDITLLTIRFRLKQKIIADINTLVKITAAELMNAKLKSVKVQIR
jgi:hypothetical protein